MNLWTRLGISVALLGIFCIVCSEMLERDGFYDNNRARIATGFGVAGVVLFLVGGVLNRKRAVQVAAERASQPPLDSEETPEADEGPFLLANLAYWGPMLIAFSLVVLFIPAKVRSATPVAARAPAPTPVPKKPEPVLPTNPEPAKVVILTNTVVFPSVKLQGIIQRGDKSSALINGETYFIGDSVGPAKVVSIFQGSIVLELNGQFRSISLGN